MTAMEIVKSCSKENLKNCWTWKALKKGKQYFNMKHLGILGIAYVQVSTIYLMCGCRTTFSLANVIFFFFIPTFNCYLSCKFQCSISSNNNSNHIVIFTTTKLIK